MQDSKFHIVYPCGNRSQLKVVEITWACSHELNDYSVASRQDFSSYKEAADYAKELAQKHGKEFIPDEDEPDYLD